MTRIETTKTETFMNLAPSLDALENPEMGWDAIQKAKDAITKATPTPNQ